MAKVEVITKEDIERKKREEEKKRNLIKQRAEEAAKRTEKVTEKVPAGSLFGRARESIKKHKKRLKNI